MPRLSHLELLVEEPSAEAALVNLLPRLVRSVSFAIHPHRGKPDLLRKLPMLLRGYRRWIPPDWGIVVLIDADSQDCREQKTALERVAHSAGFTTRSTAGQDGHFRVLNRLAIEELEAWFFGDIQAVCAAYRGLSPSLGENERYRDPDAIQGGTWEALERELQRAGHHRGGLSKIKAAREISALMEPDRNRSRSFQTFRRGLLEMVGT